MIGFQPVDNESNMREPLINNLKIFDDDSFYFYVVAAYC